MQQKDKNETPSWQETEADNAPVELGDDIHFDNVSFVYPARKDTSILNNLTLVARAGETTALVGASGCGE